MGIPITIWGRLTQDPTSRVTQTGKEIVELRVAAKAAYKDGNNVTEFFKVVLWEPNTKLAQYVKKGGGVFVSGLLVHEEWTDREGNKRLTPTIERVSDIQLTDRASDRPAQQEQPQPVAAAQGRARQRAAKQDGFDDLFASEDEMPF